MNAAGGAANTLCRDMHGLDVSSIRIQLPACGLWHQKALKESGSAGPGPLARCGHVGACFLPAGELLTWLHLAVEAAISALMLSQA